jgi:divalent metal cation (Fe/Co/Zn/Cd) transporter
MTSRDEVRSESSEPAPADPTQGESSRRGPSDEELRQNFDKMKKLEWTTLGYQIFAATLLALLAGGSQAMKTEWLENSLALIPPLGALITHQIENKRQDGKRPFGYHRAGTVAFMAAAFAIAGLGFYLFYDNSSSLLRGERASIGGYFLFGHTVWHGWLMIAAMGLTAIPQVLLGRAKKPIAILLHDKALHADAEMQHANWMTNGAGVIGLMLVAFGFWWGDALAATLISLDIMRDGVKNVAHSISDVMDHHPTDLDTDRQLPIVADVRRELGRIEWVDEAQVLMREHGRFLFSEIFVKTKEGAPPPEQATQEIRDTILPLDWRLQHVCVELCADVKVASSVLTREELEIENV